MLVLMASSAGGVKAYSAPPPLDSPVATGSKGNARGKISQKNGVFLNDSKFNHFFELTLRFKIDSMF
jgi:hypothetical protein